MKKIKALKIAIEIIKDERRKKYAFDASLYEAGIVSFSTVRGIEHYNQLTEVIEELEKLKSEN